MATPWLADTLQDKQDITSDFMMSCSKSGLAIDRKVQCYRNAEICDAIKEVRVSAE